MNHIKGEWRVNDSGQAAKHYREFVIDQDDEIVAICMGDNREEAEANAKLIAASPDLLEALTKLVAWANIKDGSNSQQLRDDCLSAIKKATE